MMSAKQRWQILLERCSSCGSPYEGMCGYCMLNCEDGGGEAGDPRHAEHCLVCQRYEPWSAQHEAWRSKQTIYTTAWLADLGRCVSHQPRLLEDIP
jgi:hypothetical protein